MLSLVFLVAEISLYLLFFMKSSNPISTAGDSTFFFFFLTHILYHLLNITPCVLLLAFLSSGPFVYILNLSIARMVTGILEGDSPGIYPFDEILPLQNLISKSLLVGLRNSFLNSYFISICLGISTSNMYMYL